MLDENSKAPDFNLKDKDGKSHQLYGEYSNYKIVYFYPKDNTPGCTLEAIEFNKDLKKFKDLGVKIYGISGGDEKTKFQFCEKNKLNLTLLSDTDFEVSKAYEAYGEKTFMGRKYNGISRVTYVLDSQNNIIKAYSKVKPIFHSNEVLKFIKKIEEK